jgi:hypothetical protein
MKDPTKWSHHGRGGRNLFPPPLTTFLNDPTEGPFLFSLRRQEKSSKIVQARALSNMVMKTRLRS